MKLPLSYGVHPTRFGLCLIGMAPKGICHLSFSEKLDSAQAGKELSRQWKNAKFVRDQKATGPMIRKIFGAKAGRPPRLFLKGTDFQLTVWKALLKIPRGSVISYEALACAIKKPGSARAVSRAVATNSIAYLIPCHRVIRKNGSLGGYRWNPARKKAILSWESSTF